MHRGYIKFWRAAEDSRVWSRGMEYRGLLITLLAKAGHRGAHFLGVAVGRGQLAVSMGTLAADLGITRQKLLRMVRNLEKDGFLSVANAGNRFSLITITNYGRYQEGRAEARPGGEAEPGQEPDTFKEGKNSHSLRECGGPRPPEEQALSADGPPLCPHERLMALYNAALPELPRARTAGGSRRAKTRARWRETWQRLRAQGKPCAAEDLLQWWRRFFERVRGSDWLMGKQTDWRADFDFLLSPKGYTGVLEGRYLPGRRGV